MSNSDSTSNSDSKLDALYKLTQLNDSVLSEDNSAEDMSPPDIDATILAAAREATTDELGPPEGNKEESRESASKTSILSWHCLLYTSPSPRDQRGSRMPSSA